MQLELRSSNPNFVLGGGWTSPQVFRDFDGSLISGTVEKLDAAGRVTDLVLTFSGTQHPSRDVLTEALMLLGTKDDQRLQ